MCVNFFKYLLSPTQKIKYCCHAFSKLTNKSDHNTILSDKNFKYKCYFLKQISQYHLQQVINFSQKLQENISPLDIKKRVVRKKRAKIQSQDATMPGFWNVRALATAEEYNLEQLMDGLLAQNLYVPVEIESPSFVNAIQVQAKYEVDTQPREIFFFQQGTVVMWNITELECNNVLEFLRQYQENSYNPEMVLAEQEIMSYTYAEDGKRSHLKKGNIYLAANENLDKYTFSNALSQTVKLGIWEASLEHYIDSIEFISEDLKKGRKIRMSRHAVLRKQGEIFALRHLINLSSDLLDTPDFYWERDDLEGLYQRICGYFIISKRTKVMNEKINHCVELVELLSSHLSDRHHIRLEWMIIVLIMVEVAFETLHYLDWYNAKYEETPITA